MFKTLEIEILNLFRDSCFEFRILKRLSRISFLVLITFISSIPNAQAAMGRKAMVATADPNATRVALEVLNRGGNAVDAAVAAQWVLNVVEPASSGIGGGGFFLYYEAETKRVYAFDGRETAPSEAFPEMFLDAEGNPLPFKPQAITGGLPVGVPGTLKLLSTVHSRFGSKAFSFRDLLSPAIYIAENGFPISDRLAYHIAQEKERLKLFEASKKFFLDKKGEPLPAGAILFQPDLAKTFKLIQKDGIHPFYEGEIAEAIVKAVRNAPYHPGYMKKDDLFYYKIIERNPVQGSYRGYDILSMSPPSSGGTTLIETLQILERYKLSVHGRNADALHLFAEAQKLAFLDRNKYLADPDFNKVPVDQLLSKEFAMKRSEEIQFQYAIPTETAVRPLVLEPTHTSHISVVDEQGNMVAYTTTIEDIFGSALMVPGYGFFLNNELTDFDMVPRDPADKLVANAPAGDKRPRSSMTPVFIFKDGKPFLIAGSPGGSKIIGTVLNVIVNLIDFGMSLEDAMAAPRIINRAGLTELEQPLYDDPALRRELWRRGHPIVLSPPLGNVQAIHFDQEAEMIYGESDPRAEGEALGY